MKKEENKGITLIALAVTIIIMLILSGVSISSLTSENGIINKTKLAREMSEVSNEKEAIELDITLANMENGLNDANKYYLGTPLYDQTLENGDKWNILINNETLEKYGTGWNYIEKNTQIPNYGTTNYSWVVNYSKALTVQIGENCTNLSYKNSLAVTNGLVLNIDATNLENENWGDIIKHGDVKYSKENRSLYFDGDGDYLELSKNTDFSNGFTFEMYANLERIKYLNERDENYKCSALFCRIPTLNSNFFYSLRFGASDDASQGTTICRVSRRSNWSGSGYNMRTENGNILTSDDFGYEVGEDFYLTFVYRVYNPEKEDSNYDEYMKENRVDKIEYYINGNLFGYTYYESAGYQDGLSIWNNNDCPFFLGVCPWNADGNLYYLKGNVYCTRLYERALGQEEVINNVTKTQLYRQME